MAAIHVFFENREVVRGQPLPASWKETPPSVYADTTQVRTGSK
jgi:hypothetical protein